MGSECSAESARRVGQRTGQRSTVCGYRFRGCSDYLRYAIALHADNVLLFLNEILELRVLEIEII